MLQLDEHVERTICNNGYWHCLASEWSHFGKIGFLTYLTVLYLKLDFYKCTFN